MGRFRSSTLRRRLTWDLVGLGLVSVLLLTAVNYVVVRALLDRSVEAQLTNLRDVRSQAIEEGLDRVRSRVSTVARDPGVVQALLDLTAGYDELDDDLTPSQVDELTNLYNDEVLSLYDEAGLDHPAADDLVPDSVAGRYVQHHYLTENPFPADERWELDDAGDGSTYSEAHAAHHQFLRELAGTGVSTDLILVSADNQDVVYSAEKRIDIGTDTVTGPYGETGLGEAIRRLPREAIGDTTLVDSVFYLPDASTPVIFMAAAVRTESRVIGAVVMQLPIGALTELTTAGQEWDLLGLGDTGETYVVGPDLTLRSDSRLWLEDPDEYLRRFEQQGYDQRRAEVIELTGSPVLLQSVDNEGVRLGLDGQTFVGTVDSYLGDETLAAIEPITSPGLQWIVVAEQSTKETSDALNSYVASIALLLAVLLPSIGVIGALLARALVRPIEPLVAAASAIADGNLEPDLPELGHNELGDLSHQLEGVAHRLRDQEQALLEEESRIEGMLGAVLPRRLVERVRKGEHGIADALDTATIVSVTIIGLPDPGGADQDATLETTARVAETLDELAARSGIERMQVSADHQLFLAGLASTDTEATAAVAFAMGITETVADLATELGVAISARVGMASGEVATGVLGTSQLSFGIWGDPPGTAVTLDAMAQPGEVLADRSVVDEMEGSWEARPYDGIVGLSDEAIDAFVLSDASPT